MSLFNAWVSSERALVSVDTAGAGVDGQAFEITKMVPLAHANAVLAGLGANTLLHAAFTACFLVRAVTTFDVLASWLPSAMNEGFERYAVDAAARFGIPDREVRKGEILLVGYSASASAMAGIRMARALDDDQFQVKPIQP